MSITENTRPRLPGSNGGQTETPERAAVDMDKLQSELISGRTPPAPSSPDVYGKRSSSPLSALTRSALSTIARETKSLTWDDCRRIGEILAKHLGTEGIDDLAAVTALQKCCDDLLVEANSQQ